MPQDFMIREATIDDVPVIMQLIQLKAEFDGCPNSVLTTADKLRVDLFGDHPLAFVLLADVAQTSSQDTVGFATYHRIYSSFLAKPGIWLDDLFIKAEFRYQGIGQALMQRLCTIAQATGCGRIDWTVAVDNANGIQFYQRIGATVQDSVRMCRLTREAIDRNVLASPHLDPNSTPDRKRLER